ncbi:8061_t:CDS:2 [Funneliformis mosseae]|uniref:8061_t:CDS:1 n=1 Tax=Funneliformis mosseae TaxID=27381 RepID=A0A9N9AFE1_FUNMO|nr:8061_t:CDS:2 [Funneliformis mosseae]
MEISYKTSETTIFSFSNLEDKGTLGIKSQYNKTNAYNQNEENFDRLGDYRDTTAIVVDEKFSPDLPALPLSTKLNVISQIRDKFGDRRFLYRGINSQNINATLTYGFIVIFRSSLRNEYGPGIYTTPNLDYAISYAGRNGMLLIFDCSNLDRNLTSKHLNDLEEWKATVKSHICLEDDDKPRPPFHEEDILEVEQVVGRTELAFKAFENRLFAIIYLVLKNNEG